MLVFEAALFGVLRPVRPTIRILGGCGSRRLPAGLLLPRLAAANQFASSIDSLVHSPSPQAIRLSSFLVQSASLFYYCGIGGIDRNVLCS